MKVSELIARLQAMDPEAIVASFSRWYPDERGKDPAQQAEVVERVVQCELSRKKDTTKKLGPLRVVCLNPSFSALDFSIGDRDKDSRGNPR